MERRNKIGWANIDEISDEIIREYFRIFKKYQTSKLIKNLETECRVLQVSDDLFFMVSINDTEWQNSYVCSPYTAFVLYAEDEARQKIKNPIIRFFLLALIKLLSVWLKSAKINKNIHVNNFLLSTNPYSDWNGNFLDELTIFLTKEFPDHAIIFRSLNEYQHTNLLNTFKSADYQLIGSRQVYIYDEDFETWNRHNNNRQDRRIIKNKALIYVSHEEMKGYLSEAVKLYNLLYLDKYSRHNPQFTELLFQEWHEKNLVNFQGYKSAENQLLTFSGCFVYGNTITSPLVGYDTSKPQKDALYIHAIRLIFDYKFKTKQLLNLSSGASYFKRIRGGLPSIEYSAVYMKHLGFYRRSIMKILQFISNRIGVPLLKKYEL